MEQMLGGLMAGIAGQMPGTQCPGKKPGMTAMCANMNTGAMASSADSTTTQPPGETVRDSTGESRTQGSSDMETDKHTEQKSEPEVRTLHGDDLSSFMNVFSSLSQRDGRKQQAPTMKDLMAMASAAGINIATSDADDEMAADATSSSSSGKEKSSNEHSDMDDANKENVETHTRTQTSNSPASSHRVVVSSDQVSSTSMTTAPGASQSPEVTHDDLNLMEGRLFNSLHEMESRLNDLMKESEQRIHAKLDAVLAQYTDSE